MAFPPRDPALPVSSPTMPGGGGGTLGDHPGIQALQQHVASLASMPMSHGGGGMGGGLPAGQAVGSAMLPTAMGQNAGNPKRAGGGGGKSRHYPSGAAKRKARKGGGKGSASSPSNAYMFGK